MTIKDLFSNQSDCYTIIQLTDNYSAYIECLNEDYVPISNNFSLDKVKHSFIELNNNEGEYYEPIQNYLSKEITLDTPIKELKNEIIEFAFKKVLDTLR